MLDWNTPSIEFYKAQGAEMLDGWTTCRITGHALVRLAGHDTGQVRAFTPAVPGRE